jgi:site-specific recombinase XerD
MFGCDDLWPSRFHDSPHLSTRQCARILRGWVISMGLEPSAFGTHSIRRTKAALICKKTGNLRTAQLLLGHTKMDNTVRYLGIELEYALEISEGVEMSSCHKLMCPPVPH